MDLLHQMAFLYLLLVLYARAKAMPFHNENCTLNNGSIKLSIWLPLAGPYKHCSIDQIGLRSRQNNFVQIMDFFSGEVLKVKGVLFLL